MLRLALAILIVAAVAGLGCDRHAPPPRGVIVVSLDTLRADHLGLYGYDRPTSPFMDELAAESIVFEDMLAHAPNTPPSHMSMLTGLLPPEHGFRGFDKEDSQTRLAPEIEPLAQILGNHGFVSGGFTGGGWVNENSGFERGFDRYDGMYPVPLSLSFASGLKWLKEHPNERFFLFLHTYQIHAPYRAPEAIRKLFVDPSYEGSFNPTPSSLTRVRRGRGKLEGADLQHTINLYDSGVRLADRHVSELVEALEKDGLLEDTILILTSDHGEEFLEHDSTGHWQIFHRPNLHVPFIVRLPRGEGAGTRIPQTAELVDLVPTVLDLLALPPLQRTSGRSWAPAIRGGAPPPPRPALSWPARFDKPGPRSVVFEGHQLLLDTRDGSAQLFDLKADPLARNDIAAERPEIVARMTAQWEETTATLQSPTVGEAAPISNEMKRNLEALGYVEPESE